MRIPSVQTIAAGLGIPRDKAVIIRGLLDGSRSPILVSPAAATLDARCFTPADKYMLKLTACNEVLGLYGVEYVKQGSNRRSPGFHYLNTGETYDTTIVRIDGGAYRICSWGDLVERGNYE